MISAMDAPLVARRFWTRYEPLHAVTYFAPEAQAAFEAAGLRGFWRGYFAGRAAPLGPVGPGVVTAAFYGFHPAFVARAVPDVWSMADPAAAVGARRAGVDAALRRLVPADALGADDVAAAAALVRDAVERCDAAGRPLFAANRELDWPNEPHLALWHATTLLREHRGDGHVVALTAAGLDGCEAHVTQIAANDASIDSIQPYRGWTDDDWAAAAERLRARGWLDAGGALTPAGRAGREEVEATTDRLAAEPVVRLGADGVRRVEAALAPLTGPVVDRLLRYPNPIGVPRPDASG
jgi:hypothetical protein